MKKKMCRYASKVIEDKSGWGAANRNGKLEREVTTYGRNDGSLPIAWKDPPSNESNEVDDDETQASNDYEGDHMEVSEWISFFFYNFLFKLANMIN